MNAGPWRRPALACLLLLEVIVLTMSYEPSRLVASSGLGPVLGNSGALLRVAIATAATLLLLVSPRLADLRQRFGEDSRSHRWEWVVLNLVFFAGLYQYTGWLFRGAAAGRDWPIGAWLLLCLAVGVAWALALAPASAWRQFAASERRTILLSLLAGLGVWLFGLLAQRFWRPLAEATLFLAHGMVRAIYPKVEYDPAAGTIGTHRLLIEIAPECSGYEGVALVTVFVGVYLWLFRDRIAFPRAFWMLPAGWLAMWLANVVRIAGLLVVGTAISPAIAVQGFHSQAGWIAFTGIALGLILVSHRVGLVVRTAPKPVTGTLGFAGALLMPFIALLGTSMVTAAFSSGFDALYPVAVLATAAMLYRYRRFYRAYRFSVSPVAVGIGLAVFAMWIGLEAMTPGFAARHAARLPELPGWLAAGWIVFRVIGSVITVPVAEELAFRGYLLRKLVATNFEEVAPTRFTWLSLGASSLLFGLLHQSWVAGTLAGAGFALAVYHRGRVTDAIVAHVVANALIAVMVLGFGWWGLWL